MRKLLNPILLSFSCLMAAALTAAAAERQDVPVLYPKDHSIVGKKVNVVLDPTEVPYFRVTVNKTEYPVVDTSRGAHAYQGVALERGQNDIIVTVLAPSGDKDEKKLVSVATRTVRVFNRDGSFSPPPAGFTATPFHTRGRESTCAGCHRLEVGEKDRNYAEPEDVLCYICHREIPKGRNIHGPAAVWNCLTCHDPDLYPARYAFSSIDPWKVVKLTQPVKPKVFTLPSSALFRPDSSLFLSEANTKEHLNDFFEYVKQNPGDKVRIEVHTDNTRPKRWKRKGKWIGFRTNRSLSRVRARRLAALITKAGRVAAKRLTFVGMGESLPKASNRTQEGRNLNDRVEIVVHSSSVKVKNSQRLPLLKDRERVVIGVSYSQGPPVKKVRIIEQVPKGLIYLKGTAFLNGRSVEPKKRGKQLVWDLGTVDSVSSESLSYVLKKAKGAKPVPSETRISYLNSKVEHIREFDPKQPEKKSKTVKETCLKCHRRIVGGKFKHGPVEAGYCNLCHDPHASPWKGWLRLASWDLCTNCHSEQATGVHVVAGFVTGNSHPTKKKKDPMKPGKRMTCASCHQPHSADTPHLFAYEAKTRSELCSLCHKK